MTNGIQKIGPPQAKLKNGIPHLTPPTKVNWKEITGIRLRLETIKLLKEIIGSKFLDNYFLDLTPKAKAKKTNKLDNIKLKSSCARKETNKMKRQHTEWKKVFSNYISDNGLVSKI